MKHLYRYNFRILHTHACSYVARFVEFEVSEVEVAIHIQATNGRFNDKTLYTIIYPSLLTIESLAANWI